MKYNIVTTFNDDGYNVYGKRMIETFAANWKGDVTIHAYYEGTRPTIDYDNVVYHDLMAYDKIIDFKHRHQNDPVANGMPNTHKIEGGVERKGIIKPKWEQSESYLWNAVRFCHKVFAQTHAATVVDGDVMFWFDADTVTFAPVNESAMKKLLPTDYFCSYLGRITYSECGFLGYDMNHPYFREFMNRFELLYTSDAIFDVRQWTDCHAFDLVRNEMEAEEKIVNFDLNPDNVKGHPFVNSIIGDYVDHLKGKRKQNGKSHKNDIVAAKKQDYWK